MRVAAVSPEAALTLGASPGQLRFIAFTIAAIGTGIAGLLYARVDRLRQPLCVSCRPLDLLLLLRHRRWIRDA